MTTTAAAIRTEKSSRSRNIEQFNEESKQVPSIRKRAILGLLGAILVIGPVIGGYCSDNFRPQSIICVEVLSASAMFAMWRYSSEGAPLSFDLFRRGDGAGMATLPIVLCALETLLEEGETDGWLGSTFILRLSIVAVEIVAIIAFVMVTLVRKQQLMHLRLLVRRNFCLGTLTNIFFGLSMYGWVYIIPLVIAVVSMVTARSRSVA
ncbi:hypothetical protein EKH79_03295 [Dyella dinghuensis]|uniref:Uncharacterized protein n=1 Tax=Dyella dinghuensis TaxID=1920169 RepID=A0A3S0S4J4_9GAMM|nr:hypothetical protein [Dyella dinghuensis]RUL65749.1 hypothetical protein EKH79_03295 [Dyella dinghuensis]